MKSRERFLAACRCEDVDRPPVWFMRQAGRYLPEYRAVRSEHSFWEMVRTPELAVEVTLQPVRRFGVDAAILFSDILPVLDAMGAGVQFAEGGPRVDPPVRSAGDVERLTVPDPARDLPYVAESVRRLVQELHPEKALIGFAGAPLTLAAYAVEGGTSKDLRHLKRLAYTAPHVLENLLDKLVEAVSAHLRAQVEAGCDAVQIFDTWAGLLAPDDYERWALPAQQRVVERLSDLEVPVIVYMRGWAGVIDIAKNNLSADVFSIDTGARLDAARRELGPKRALQGNLDPIALFAPPETVRERVTKMLEATGGVGHIVNVGQGLVPETPVEGVAAAVAAVQEFVP